MCVTMYAFWNMNDEWTYLYIYEKIFVILKIDLTYKICYFFFGNYILYKQEILNLICIIFIICVQSIVNNTTSVATKDIIFTILKVI